MELAGGCVTCRRRSLETREVPLSGRLRRIEHEFIASTSAAVAIDARNGDIVWREGYGGLTYGGVAYANGVVFTASVAGGIYAYDTMSGSALWGDRAPEGPPIAGSPTVASGRLIVPSGYQWTLREGTSGRGGMTVYGL